MSDVPEHELRRAADEVLAMRPDEDGVWVFAYGALMWDDSFKADAAHAGTVAGMERSYCIWDERNRGTPARRSLTTCGATYTRCRTYGSARAQIW